MITTKTPLIVRLPNWVGDVIMSLPAINALEQAGFDLQLLGKPWITDLLKAYPAPIFKLPKTLIAQYHCVHKMTPSKCIIFTNGHATAFITRLAGKECIGYSDFLRQFLLNAHKPKPRQGHEVESFWKLAQLAATTWRPNSPWPPTMPQNIYLPISASSNLNVEKQLAQKNISSPFIILNPLATGLTKQGLSKIWPHWTKLSKKLHKNQINCIACPGPAEEDRCRTLVPEATLIPGLNLNELGAIMKKSCGVISNDSGPMHIASAVGCPVLGLFGSTTPDRTFPWGGAYLGKLGEWPSIDQVMEHVYNSFFSNRT